MQKIYFADGGCKTAGYEFKGLKRFAKNITSGRTYIYKVCEAGTSNCSVEQSIAF